MYPPPGLYDHTRGQYGVLDSYGSLNLTVTSPSQSFTEPLTLVEVRDYLKLPTRQPADQDEESTLAGLISGARVSAEILQNRDLVVKQWDLSLDYWPSWRIVLRAPLVGVDLVQYRDSTGTLNAMTVDADYIVDGAKRPPVVLPPYNKTWPTFAPWPSSAILIRYRSGMATSDPFWSNTGAAVKVGMRRLIAEWFHNRLPFNPTNVAELPFGITACLSFGAIPRVK